MAMMTNPMEKLTQSIENQDPVAFADAIGGVVESKAEQILADAVHAYDSNIMQARGARQLTSEERAFWTDFAQAAKSSNFKDAVSGLEKVLPDTTISQIFDDLEVDKSLMSMLDVQQTNAKVKVLFSKDGGGEATWGALDADITTEAAGTIGEIESGAIKLTAKLILNNSMLDLGPEYLDRFCRTILGNYLQRGIEKAVITNLTSNTGPIGMNANMSTASLNSSTGVVTYTVKTATAITEWTPSGLATVLAAMAKDDDGNPRDLGELFMVVNPSDYYTIIQPAICVQNTAGDWVEKSPVPVTIIKSKYVTAGTAIMGVKGQYILTLCTAESGKLEYSDDVKFLEDSRAYRIKLYGNGRPKDNTSFQLLNISGLESAAIYVKTNAVAVVKE